MRKLFWPLLAAVLAACTIQEKPAPKPKPDAQLDSTTAAAILGAIDAPAPQFTISTPEMAAEAPPFKLADIVLDATQETSELDAFRVSVFDFHMGAYKGFVELTDNPVMEYAFATDAGLSEWISRPGVASPAGFTIKRIPGTTWTDFKDPATCENLANAYVTFALLRKCQGTLFDCFNMTAPGEFWNVANWFINYVVPKYNAAGLIALVNFGSWDAWMSPWSFDPWNAIAKAATAELCQVGMKTTGYTTRQFSMLVFTMYQRLAAGDLLIIGIWDPGRVNESVAKSLLSAGISKHPMLYWHYNADPGTDPGASVKLQYPSFLPQPVELGLNSPLAPLGTLYARADNWWNLDVRGAPIDPKSAEILGKVKTYDHHYVHPDFGGPWGIPYAVVGNETPLVAVAISNASESDKGYPGGPIGYPIPAAATVKSSSGTWPYIEAGGSLDGDRHLLLYHRDLKAGFELAYAKWDGTKWSAGYGAVFKLDQNYRRTDGWTSTDAAGLCVLAGLIRYDEVYGTQPIRHALRASIKRIGTHYAPAGYVWPASHKGSDDAGAPPLGMRLRLKLSVDLDAMVAGVSNIKDREAMKRLLVAMQTYGLIIADRGGNLYVQGTLDARWNNAVLNPTLHKLNADHFDVIQLGWGKTQ